MGQEGITSESADEGRKIKLIMAQKECCHGSKMADDGPKEESRRWLAETDHDDKVAELTKA